MISVIGLRLLAVAFSTTVLWFVYNPSTSSCAKEAVLKTLGHCLLDQAYSDSESIIHGELPSDKQAQSKEPKQAL